MLNRSILIIVLVMMHGFLTSTLFGKNKTELKKLEPANWWVGMEVPTLQLMAYGTNISETEVRLDYPGVVLQQVIKVQNPNYLFIDLYIKPDSKPGIVPIEFHNGKKLIKKIDFPLLERKQDSKNRIGFNAGDAIYLIMPDRFANGDPTNDDVEGMLEKSNRKAPYGRHGGDIKGIDDHLDYIKDLGFTAIWLNPIQENNQPRSSYHGYAITDYYNVDARFGTNEDFKNLVDHCNQKGIKMIMDMVFNHCGHFHWWMDDLPTEDWLNQFPEFTRSNYRLSTVSDPYASHDDLIKTTQGWFDTSMPDLNLKQPLLLNYLIQNSIWWIEYAGLSGIRMDTYPYPDKEGMAVWAQRIMKEYPNFNIVGEAWISQTSKLAYWQKDFPNQDGYNSHLPSLMDFPMYEAMKAAFNEETTWDKGLSRLYDVLADDHLYPDPMNMVVFPENHDAGRLFYQVEKDIHKLKMVLAFASTTRGILQLYYGSELLMDGDGAKSHADIRKDFPGGWAGDKTNAFTKEGRTADQNEIVDFMTKLLNYRKESEVIPKGKLMHFIPEDELYVYFRYTDNKALMVILNNSDTEDKKVNTKRFNELISNYSTGKNIMTDQPISDLSFINSPAKSAVLIELNK